MADTIALDISKLKVIELRKELKARGLTSTGDKAELVARLQAALVQDNNLDSYDIDSDGVLDDEDDKSQDILLDETAEELALADQPILTEDEVKPAKIAKINPPLNSALLDLDTKTTETKEVTAKKIVLNRPNSISSTGKSAGEKDTDPNKIIESNGKVKITATMDPKSRLEMRAKRFGLPVKTSDDERKEARKLRFGLAASANSTTSSVSLVNKDNLSETHEKLKKRAERFGQSVSKIMTVIENKERLEKRKAKFGTVK